MIFSSENEINEDNMFQETETQKKYNENVAKNKAKLSKAFILKRILLTLKLLADNDIIINNETITEDVEFKKIYDNLSKSNQEYLNEYGIDESFDLFNSYRIARSAFYYRNDATDNVFDDYSFNDLKKCGIFEKIEYDKYIKSCIDKNNFIAHGPKEFLGINIITGTFYDEYGKKVEDYQKELEEYDDNTRKNIDDKTERYYLIRKALVVLKILSESGFNINNYTVTQNTDFKNLYRNLSSEKREILIKNGINEKYDLYSSYQGVKDAFYRRNSQTDKLFEKYSIKELEKMRSF